MKKTEQELREAGAKVAEIIYECLILNNIEIGIGMDALQCIYAYTMQESDMTYQEYCKSLDMIKKGYEKLWEKK